MFINTLNEQNLQQELEEKCTEVSTRMKAATDRRQSILTDITDKEKYAMCCVIVCTIKQCSLLHV